MTRTDSTLDKDKIAVLLPAYNEAQTISSTIKAFHTALPDAFIIVINNNSQDDTARLANACIAELGCRGEVINEARQGKANAVRRAFLEVEADIYLMADADLTYPADRAKDLIAPIASGEADMVVGDRRSGGEYARENKRAMHGFGNDLVQKLVNFLFKAK
ncbi:MAG TPA: glycosyltransferase family 2 protein, partial [Pseudomonadales bacterium]|nr:glycosyltransferase family 2 protein [Pseudomonadales bacterium]